MRVTTFLGLVILGMLTCLLPQVAVNVWSNKVLGQVVRGMAHPRDLSLAPPGHERAVLWQARLTLAQGDTSAAIGILEADSWKSPQDPMTQMLLASALLKVGDYGTAVPLLRELRAFNMLWFSGRAAFQAREWEHAALALSAAHGLMPENVIVTRTLLSTYIDGVRDPDAGIRLLRQAIESTRNDGEKVVWLLELGRVCENETRWQQAAAAYAQVLAIQPTNARAHGHTGWTNYQLGQPLETVLADMELALKLAPEDSDGYTLVGQLHAAEGRHNEAVSWFRRAANLPSATVWPLVHIADENLASGSVLEAVDVLNEAATRYPADGYVHYRLADAYMRLRDPEHALVAVQRALGIEAFEPRYSVLAGRIFEALGRWTEAADAYRQALVADQANVSARQGLMRVQGRS